MWMFKGMRRPATLCGHDGKGVMVATGADLQERLAPMPVIPPCPKPDHWPITWDQVRFGGDPIAVVALRVFGTKHVDMRLRPEKIWRIMHGHAS